MELVALDAGIRAKVPVAPKARVQSRVQRKVRITVREVQKKVQNTVQEVQNLARSARNRAYEQATSFPSLGTPAFRGRGPVYGGVTLNAHRRTQDTKRKQGGDRHAWFEPQRRRGPGSARRDRQQRRGDLAPRPARARRLPRLRAQNDDRRRLGRQKSSCRRMAGRETLLLRIGRKRKKHRR